MNITSLDFAEATLRLFRGLQADNDSIKPRSKGTINRMLSNGYVLHSSIVESPQILHAIEEVLIVNEAQLNSTFHKSWGKVNSSPLEQLWLEQAIHYFTTYGFQSLGIYDENSVYIPNEELEVPELEEDFPLFLIRAFSVTELYDKIVELGSSGIALSTSVLDDIMTIIEYNAYSMGIIEGITNRELYSRLCDYFDFVPSEPVEYLRFLINKLTGTSLIIKNRSLIGMIKQADGEILDKYLEYAPSNLASIFLRFKPLFLAMKSISSNKTFFNKLRKNSVYDHEPMEKDVLGSVTSDIKQGRFSAPALMRSLTFAPIWRKIRLANSLSYRLAFRDAQVSLYKVRNGRAWVKQGTEKTAGVRMLNLALTLTLDSIAVDLSKNVSNKVFYIPSHINYAVPATQKQFVGNLPANTYVTTGEEPVVLGVHWYDTNRTVDLDISLLSVNGKVGWDRYTRTDDALFSGDLTHAPKPKGSSELFFLKNGFDDQLVMANYFNMPSGDFELVPAHLVVARGNSDKSNKFMIDPNNIILPPQLVEVKDRMTAMGLVTNIDGENRVYINSFAVGNGRSSGYNSEVENGTREVMFNSALSSIRLANMIAMAGGIIIDELPEDDSVEYIDLSPETLDATTILELFT